MARIDVVCSAADAHVHEVDRPARDWPATPPCPTCGAVTQQTFLPPRVTWTVDPVVVYRSPDGQYRFPGDAHGPGAAKYQQLGFTRVEIRSATEMRRFERTMNEVEYTRAARRVEHQQRQRETRERESRSELRARMQSMSTAGRAIARAAMARNDGKPLPRATHANFHSEVYAFNRSNRDESRGPDGRRRRD